MLYGKYRLYCTFETEAMLPYFKGSTFRGVFGVALKRVVCVLKNVKCEECLLRPPCLYVRVFEDRSGTPRPFVIEPPMSSQTHYPEGSSFDFNLILFGNENENLGYFIYSLVQMGRIGIGKRINSERGRYVLQRVVHGESEIYSRETQVLNLPEDLQDISPDNLVAANKPCHRLRVNILTPLRVKFKNRLSGELPFHVLVRAMLRRASSLFSNYDLRNPDLDYRGMVTRAGKVKISESDLRWYDWRRYSNRQHQSMRMGGMVGSIVYEGNLTEFIPLVEFSKNVHVGKQTTFGLGKISYEILA